MEVEQTNFVTHLIITVQLCLPGVMKTGLANTVIFLNFPCLIAWLCLLCFWFMSFFLFLLVLWLGVCIEVDVDRITILPPLPIFFPYPQFFL